MELIQLHGTSVAFQVLEGSNDVAFCIYQLSVNSHGRVLLDGKFLEVEIHGCRVFIDKCFHGNIFEVGDGNGIQRHITRDSRQRPVVVGVKLIAGRFCLSYFHGNHVQTAIVQIFGDVEHALVEGAVESADLFAVYIKGKAVLNPFKGNEYHASVPAVIQLECLAVKSEARGELSVIDRRVKSLYLPVAGNTDSLPVAGIVGR